jgi:hypothetical protein
MICLYIYIHIYMGFLGFFLESIQVGGACFSVGFSRNPITSTSGKSALGRKSPLLNAFGGCLEMRKNRKTSPIFSNPRSSQRKMPMICEKHQPWRIQIFPGTTPRGSSIVGLAEARLRRMIQHGAWLRL